MLQRKSTWRYNILKLFFIFDLHHEKYATRTFQKHQKHLYLTPYWLHLPAACPKSRLDLEYSSFLSNAPMLIHWPCLPDNDLALGIFSCAKKTCCSLDQLSACFVTNTFFNTSPVSTKLNVAMMSNVSNMRRTHLFFYLDAQQICCSMPVQNCACCLDAPNTCGRSYRQLFSLHRAQHAGLLVFIQNFLWKRSLERRLPRPLCVYVVWQVQCHLVKGFHCAHQLLTSRGFIKVWELNVSLLLPCWIGWAQPQAAQCGGCM